MHYGWCDQIKHGWSPADCVFGKGDLSRRILKNMPPPVSREEQIKHGWNPADRSLNICIENDDDGQLFHLVYCIRGKVGFSSGFHVWEIHWPISQRATHSMIGVATTDAPLSSDGCQSWGWDIASVDYFQVPDTIQVVLDMDEGTLSYTANGLYVGVAFRGLKGHTLYPIVNTDLGCGYREINMTYLYGLYRGPLPLADICRRVIRHQLIGEGGELEKKISELGLPRVVKAYLLDDEKNP